MEPDVTRLSGAGGRPESDSAAELGRRPGQDDVTGLGAPVPQRAAPSREHPPAETGAPSSASPAAGGGLLQTGEAFGPRYHIIRELGVGGMGAVYHAWDEELGVAVALKLIRPVIGDEAAARELELRFKRELLLARQVTHKNVCRIHDLGELNGIKYITMPYVEGEDLARILEAHGKLPVDRTLAIARQVVSGLRAAHDVGIVHRDLKPANIMMEDDVAFIMDFGIARSTTSPQSAASAVSGTGKRDRPSTSVRALSPLAAASASLTMVGSVVGTVQYMAPEQARGETADHRADIYAFGLIVYDLLLGRRREAGHESAINELMARMKAPPPAPRTLDPTIPAAFEAVVQRCLAPDAADRFQTTAELAAALDRLDDHGIPIPEPEPEVKRLSTRVMAAAAVLVSLLVGGTFWLARQNALPPVEPPPVSVLVADFVNRTDDPVFSGLIEQALAVGLEGASFVTAYPRRDALQLAGQITPGGRLDQPTATLVALREGVGRLVGGAIEPAGAGYRITATLIEPSDGTVLQTFSEESENRDAVLATVGALAGRVRAGLGDESVGGSAPGADESFTAASLDAARAYATGQELQWAGRAEDAMAEYQKAVTLDPKMGRAYSGLGALADSLGRKQEAEQYYKQALAQLDRMTDREKFRTRGGYYLLTRSADKARDEFQALVDRYPADTAGLANLALAYFYQREMGRAVEIGRRAVDIYPKNVIRRNNLALFAMYASDFEAAEREAGEVLKLNPAREKAFVALAMAQTALGRPEDARATYVRLQQTSATGRSMAANGLADLALYRGRLDEATGILEAAIAAEADVSRRRRLVVTLAEARFTQGRRREAATLAAAALEGTTDPGHTFLAARVLALAGEVARAQDLAEALAQRLDTESQVYGDLVAGEIALHQNNPRRAIERFKAAQQVTSSWLGRYGLGRAYLLGEAYAEADSEFDAALKRRGEGAAVLLDDVPTLRLIAPLAYYRGRVREGLGSPGADESYRQFLAIKEGGAEEDLVTDARRRLGKSQP